MWLARGKDEFLSTHSIKPYYGEYGRVSYIEDYIGLPKSEFPEVTFENSPIEITSLKIK